MDKPIISQDNIMSPNWARRTVERYVCARCWSKLEDHAIEGSQRRHVTCPECGDGCGFITLRTMEIRQENNKLDAIVVRSNLRHLFNNGPQKTVEEMIKDLGF
jgi:DNA-directed RNA polymerase subunit RPC12/RpoP